MKSKSYFLGKLRNVSKCYLLKFLPSMQSVIVQNFEQVILLPVAVSLIAGRVANSVDPDQTPPSVASDLGLHCMLRPIRILRVNIVRFVLSFYKILRFSRLSLSLTYDICQPFVVQHY